MTVRFLVNFGLLALPIAVTIGILLGLESHREAVGKPPLFAPDNKVVSNEYCQKSFGIHPLTKGQEYTLNPNQWGWDEGDEGELCLTVWTHNNNTYATNTTAPDWSVTWEYPQATGTLPVHAFPNIKVDGDVLPAKLSAIQKIEIDFDWSYGVGKKAANKTDLAALKKIDLNANVAMDMFLHKDKAKSLGSEDATHEIMVWFAAIGPSTQPLGFNGDGKNPLATKMIHGTEFKLYYDENENKQKVLTWYVDEPVTKFKGDLAPLVEKILDMDDADYPSASDYMGYMSWGTEAYYSNAVVTFDVPSLSIDVVKS